MTSQSARYWCVVPAAGVGKRMGAGHPKQYLSLFDKTVCEHTLLRLLQIAELEKIVVSISAEDTFWPQLAFKNEPRIEQAIGGQERCDSVLNGLEALKHCAGDNDWVLVHDVARPCVRPDDIRKLMRSTENHPCGGLLAMPVRDTMKRANEQQAVTETVCRENLWHALTPQLFRYGQLREALARALAEGVQITDESSAMEWGGYQPLLVEGHPDNIKITHPNDLSLALLFLQQQQQEPTSEQE